MRVGVGRQSPRRVLGLAGSSGRENPSGIVDPTQSRAPAEPPARPLLGWPGALLAAGCALVLVVFAFFSEPASTERDGSVASQAYNRLVDGFRAGQLSLRQTVPAGLLALPDPYDPSANARFRAPPDRLIDLSYYRGKLYVYFGAAPAVVLFWPAVALSGRYLSQRAAVVIFCSLGFLASAGLLVALWRRYFSQVGVGLVLAGILALGFATGLLDLLQSPTFHEVAVSAGYAFSFLALGALWRALHRPEERGRWLAAASFLFGLAVASRPSLVLGAGILLLPLALEWRTGRKDDRRKQMARLAAAALIPIALLGLGVMRYNALRFNNPFEFGDDYILAGDPQRLAHPFSWHYAGFNVRMYLFAAARWSAHFPFVHAPIPPPVPAGHRIWRSSFGILPNLPIAWLALAFPAVFWGRGGTPAAPLRCFGAAVAWVFAASTVLLAFYGWTFARYEIDFLPALVLLALWGALGWAARPPARCPGCVVQGVFFGLVLWSLAFGLLLGVSARAMQWVAHGSSLVPAGRLTEAMADYRKALQLDPDSVEAHAGIGLVLEQQGQRQAAVEEGATAVRLAPAWAQGQLDWGTALAFAGRLDEAIPHYRAALRLDPQLSDAHNNLGIALARTGRMPEAAAEFQRSLETGLDSATLETNLGNVFFLGGQVGAAVAHYETALGLDPGYAPARENLAAARRALSPSAAASPPP